MKHQRIFEELSDFREKDCGGQKDDHQMAMTNQGDGTGVEPGCCRMAMTNHFTPMVRAWNLGVVGWRSQIILRRWYGRGTWVL